MALNNAFFNIRTTKRSNPEARTTLDALHRFQVDKMNEKVNTIHEQKNEMYNVSTIISQSKDKNELAELKARYSTIKGNIDYIQSNSEMYKYFLDTGEILYNYYDIQDKINNGVEPIAKKKTNMSNPGNILAVLEMASKESGCTTTEKTGTGEELGREKLLEKYLHKIDPSHTRSSHEIEFESFGNCPTCETEMIFSANEANFTCVKCGYQDFVLIDSDKPSYKDPPREVSYYAYKRINHFNEWLAQFQAKETTEVPVEVYEALGAELKKERIMDYRTLKASKVKEILKKLKFNKYYEHIPHIINHLNGQNAPVMNREVEEKLRYMFKEIQPSFQAHCPKERSNFLSYSYVLYKFCELLDLDEYLPCFPLLKNRDKLYVQDKIWQKICADLSWEFIKSI